jgi:flavodoxin
MVSFGVYFASRTGNTAKVAKVLAEELSIPAIEVDSATRLDSPVDVLFIGGAIYAGGLDGDLKRFIKSLDPKMVGAVVTFSTNTWSGDANEKLRALAKKTGLNLEGESLHVMGHFISMKRDRPNQDDLDEVKAFAARIANRFINPIH